MNAYHLFREGDESFVYHLDSGRFIRVTPAAYDLLELRETMPAADAEAAFRARHPGETGVLTGYLAYQNRRKLAVMTLGKRNIRWSRLRKLKH